MNAKEMFESLGYHRYAKKSLSVMLLNVNMELLGAIIKQCIEIGWQPILEIKK